MTDDDPGISLVETLVSILENESTFTLAVAKCPMMCSAFARITEGATHTRDMEGLALAFALLTTQVWKKRTTQNVVRDK